MSDLRLNLPPHRHTDLPAPKPGLGQSAGRLAPALDRRPVRGGMARYVGVQHEIEALYRNPCFEMIDAFSLWDDRVEPTPEELASLARVRAFHVPVLIGIRIEAPCARAFPEALRASLRSHCPGIAWEVPEEAAWPLPRFLFFNVAVAAPIDETTGQPMALELFGRVEAAFGARLDTAAGQAWLRQYQAWRDERRDGDPAPDMNQALALLDTPLQVLVATANYANVQCTGVGVPFWSG
jgi:hypothetical protein